MKPARPGRLRLYDEPWKACGKSVCLTPGEAQRSLENKVEVNRWMRDANNLIDFHEAEDAPVKPVQMPK